MARSVLHFCKKLAKNWFAHFEKQPNAIYMKILQLCKKFPYPLKDGESIAVNSLSRALCELDCEVKLLAMNTRKHFFDLKQLPSSFNHYADIQTIEIDNRVKPFDAFLNLFSNKSYHVARFCSQAFEQKLKALLELERFDVIQLETLYLAPYIPLIRAHSNAIIAMRAHNVEFEIWHRVAKNASFFLKKWYLQHLSKKLKAYEINQLHQYDLLLPITQRDQEIFHFLGYTGQSVVTPVGIDIAHYAAPDQPREDSLSIGFIGSLDWMPNQEGLIWFLEKVWKTLHARFPLLQLHIAGRNAPAWLKRLKMPNVVVHGEVADAAAFIKSHPIMIVPLLSGSGMRIKILEGMALERLVITTHIGLEGIDAVHQKEVLIADDVSAFEEALRLCYDQPNLVRQLGKQARSFVLEQYDSRQIAQKVLETYQQLKKEKAGAPTSDRSFSQSFGHKIFD